MYVIALGVTAAADGSPASLTIAYLTSGEYETACCAPAARPWTWLLDGALDAAERVVAHDAARTQRLLAQVVAAEGHELPDLGIECVRTRALRLFPGLDDDSLPGLCRLLGLEMPWDQKECAEGVATGLVSAALDRHEAALRRGVSPALPQPRPLAALAA